METNIFRLNAVIVLNDYLAEFLIIYVIVWWATFCIFTHPVYCVGIFGTVIVLDWNVVYFVMRMHVVALKAMFALSSLGVEFKWRSTASLPLRRSPTYDIFVRFIERCRIHYVGITNIDIPNMRGVLHPVDYFVSGLYDMYGKAQKFVAMETYKRTNPTLALKLVRLEDYADSNALPSPIVAELVASKHSILTDVLGDPGFQNTCDLLHSVTKGDFDFVEIDGSSAAGFPYKAGVKKREVKEEAITEARKLLINDEHFDHHMSEHVWYTTGRAKLQAVSKADASRLICYPGFSTTMFAMLYYQSWQTFMNTRLDWCGVGMSWFNHGAAKFAKFFGDNCGVAPEGFRYVSVDIKNWDGSLSADLLSVVGNFHNTIMQAASVNERYRNKFSVVFDDMINAKILFPMGHTFQARCGMKSGWCGTANDNTLAHELVFRAIEKRLGIAVKHKLYGDDNFMLVPDHISSVDIISAYALFGLPVGTIHESKYLKEVDFLAKYLVYQDGEYFVTRPSVETDARLLMPEELDPSRRDIPDGRIAAERLIGHLFDNPFNVDVRSRIYLMLEHLKKHYKIESVIIDESKLRRAPFRFMDPKRLLGEIPIIPDFNFIKELYGVDNTLIAIDWPAFRVEPIILDYTSMNDNCNRFFAAQEYYEAVERNVFSLTKKRRKLVVKSSSPFRPPKYAKGFHGARLEYALKHWRIVGREILDFGAHPGACAYSFAKDPRRNILCVSLVPSIDKHRVMPYIIKQDNVEFVEMDADKFVPEIRYDVIHDDIDVVGPRDYLTNKKLALAALARFKKLNRSADTALMTVHEMSIDVIEAIYMTYAAYGWFDIIKPLWSNPWKPEYMLCFKKSSAPIMRRAQFVRALYSFLNQHASAMVYWSEALNANAELAMIGKDVIANPLQDNADMQARFGRYLDQSNG